MSHRVVIALGSNSRQSVFIAWASQRLAAMLHEVRLSRTLWTADVKGSGAMYMNRLVSGTTSLSAETLAGQLKQLEQACGRTKQQVTLDADLMLYDDERHHLSDWPRPYIQRLIDQV